MKTELLNSIGCRGITEKQFAYAFPNDYESLLHWSFPTGFKFPQKLYHYVNDDENLELGLCAVCGKRCRFISLHQGYCRYCSLKCKSNSQDVAEKYKRTMYERYGVDNAFKSGEIKERIKNTNLERYGVEHLMKSKDEYNKRMRVVKEKYGVDNPAKSETAKANARTTNLERYGVDNPAKSEAVKVKERRTNLERYGVICPLQNKEVRRKANITNLERYGTEYASQSNDVKDRMKTTNLERYGVEYVTQSDEVKEKVKATNLERYGVEYITQSDEIKEKIKRTNIERYGVENPMQSDEVKNKVRNTNIEKYGVEWFCQTDAARNYSNNSKPNLEFEYMLNEIGILYEREFPINSYSYDFKIGKTLIEVNPTITHNSVLNIFGGKPKDKDYHLNKSKTAKDNGYSCIHVWDWDDKSKIVNMVKPKKTLYARKLDIYEIGIEDANEFLNAYHLQKTCKGQKAIYGLCIGDEIVEVMSFGKPRYNRNYEWELLRLCTHSDYIVVGGAERLFRHFVNEHNPKSVISYCDNGKFNGNVYERLGFAKKSVSNPTKHWYDLKTKRHITDNFLRQRGFDQLFGTDYGKGTSNEELMLEYGFLPVYDCGQTAFIYEFGESDKETKPSQTSELSLG